MGNSSVEKLREALEQWKNLALRAIDCLHDVERETEWGQPTFGPTVWERLRDEQNELLAALNSIPDEIGEGGDVEKGWQPIETAPKDGSPLRLYDPEYADEEMGSSFDGHWTDCREDGSPGFVAAIWNNCQDYWATVSVAPTHWMPLPEIPVAALSISSPDDGPDQ